MGLSNFAKWFGLQVEIDNSRAVAERAYEAAGNAIDRGNEQQAWHLTRVGLRMDDRADFYEAVQKGFEGDQSG